MTYYIKNGNTYRPTDESNVDIRTTLPVGNYVIKVDQFDNMFFEVIDSFNFSSKRYGDNPRHTKRILDTFMSRENATGVMLVGEKGSGKSLLAKTVAMEAANLGVPTIVINQPFHGESFNTFIQAIEQPAVVIFDEFEKVYDAEGQEAILTLLDGVFPTKKLFMITSNDKWRVDQHMRNRPGRIFYMLEFKGLDNNFIIEYCNDNLNEKKHIPKICNIAALFTQFNFDMLKALVEEMNRYNESPEEALEMLNAKPEFEDNSEYEIELYIGGVKVEADRKTWKGNPLNRHIDIGYRVDKTTPELKLDNSKVGLVSMEYGNQSDAIIAHDYPSDKDTISDYAEVMFNYSHLTHIDPAEGVFTFSNGNIVLRMKKMRVKHFKYGDLF